jgi:hypothetical protein
MTDRSRADIHYDFQPSRRDRRRSDDLNEGLAKWQIRSLAEVSTVIATIIAILSFAGATPTQEQATSPKYRSYTRLELVVSTERLAVVITTRRGVKTVRTLKQHRREMKVVEHAGGVGGQHGIDCRH